MADIINIIDIITDITIDIIIEIIIDIIDRRPQVQADAAFPPALRNSASRVGVAQVRPRCNPGCSATRVTPGARTGYTRETPGSRPGNTRVTPG